LLLGGSAALRALPRWLVEFLWRLVNGWQSRIGIGLRWILARRLAASLGENVLIGPDVEIRGWKKLRIGNNVSIHRFCYIDAEGEIEIGNDVSIAHNCSILSTNHRWTKPDVPIRDNPVSFERVVINSDVWLGCGVRVLAGITLGRRVVVAAGAVVTRSADDNLVLGGVPARPISSTEILL
jgi:acetyltransferase-like isoleucine patch superfamily enzyme